MAASTAALEILFQAKDEASGIAQNVTQSLGGVGNILGTIGPLAATAGAAVVAGLGAGAAMAFDFASDVSSAMQTFQAQTGTSADALSAFEDVAMDVFTAGWGDSMADVTDAMAQVHQVLDETGGALEESTQRAIILGDTFGLDVAESVNIAAAAIDSGLVDSSQEAFDLITTGFQEGLNRAGDFGDTVQEYASDFERLGFTSEEVLGVLNAGLEEGAYNTDVVADGIREFGIRFGAAEETAVQALEAIGINSEDLYAQYEAGEITVADAMETITSALGNVDSKTLQAQAGAALFGSKWEDVGGNVFMAAGQARDAIGEIEGATDAAGDALNQGLGPAWTVMKRTALEAIQPIGDTLLGIATTVMTAVGPVVVSVFQNQIGPAIERVAGFVDTFFLGLQSGQGAMEQVRAVAEALLAPFGGLASTMGQVNGVLTSLQPAWVAIQTVFQTLVAAVLPPLQAAWQSISQTMSAEMGPILAELQGLWAALLPVLQAVATFIGANLVAVLGILLGHVSGLAQGVADAFPFILNTIQGVIQVVTGILDVFSGVVQGLTALIRGDTEAQAAAWDKMKQGVVKIVNGLWSTVKNLFLAAFNAIKGYVTGFIDAIVGFFTSLYQQLVGGSIIPDMMAAMQQIIEGALAAIQAVWEAVLQAMKAVVEAVLSAIKGVWETSWQAMRTIGEAVWSSIRTVVETAINAVHGVVTAVLQALSGDWEGAWQTMRGVGETVWAGIQSVAETAINAVFSVVTSVLSSLGVDWEAGWQAMVQKVQGGWNHIKSVAEMAINMVFSVVTSVLSSLGVKWEAGWQAMVQNVRAAWNQIKSVIASATSAVLQKIRRLIQSIRRAFTGINWREIGGAVVNGIAAGINSAAGRIADAAREAARAAWQAAKDFLGINCPDPSPVTAELGIGMGEGLREGILSMIPETQAAMADLLGEATGTMTVGVRGGRRQGLAMAGSGGGARGGAVTIEVPVTLDGREIARATARVTTSELRRQGVIP